MSLTEEREEPLSKELENERAVIERCQEGDIRAFETVYRHYQQALLNLGLKMLGRQEDAEDAVQLTFVKLYRGITKFRFRAKFSTYLFRIMMNVCFDLLKRRGRLDSQELGDADCAYKPGLDLKIQLEEAIDSLPGRMRACFVLFAVQQFKQSEVAEILNLNIGTVKAHVFQAKRRLRGLLTDTPSETGK